MKSAQVGTNSELIIQVLGEVNTGEAADFTMVQIGVNDIAQAFTDHAMCVIGNGKMRIINAVDSKFDATIPCGDSEIETIETALLQYFKAMYDSR